MVKVLIESGKGEHWKLACRQGDKQIAHEITVIKEAYVHLFTTCNLQGGGIDQGIAAVDHGR